MDRDAYITVPQMAKLLSLSKARCYQLLQGRQIRHARFGERAVRVLWGDVVQYIESRTLEADSEVAETKFGSVPKTNREKRDSLDDYLRMMDGKLPSQEHIASAVRCSQGFVSNYLRELEGKKERPKAVTGEPRKPKSPNRSRKSV